ncbi:LysR substrate-binding domain-containing protein [Vibrio sp. 10N.286.49.B1]|uniref:LysR substrate-binding domain-containing protein n=1 Tax=unclassified Vibrio TaxID=2614977 RepID=UPI002411152F|nr:MULTISPECIES: LysR substrate-binding domain-containing protein [unclassified Vibrio]
MTDRELDMLIRKTVEGVPQHFNFYNIGTCESLLVCAPDHELNSGNNIVFEDLLLFPQIYLCSDNDAAVDILKGAGERIDVQRLLDQVQLIEQGFGWGFVTRSLAEDQINQGTLVQFFPEFSNSGKGIFMLEALNNSGDQIGPAQMFLLNELKKRP